MGSNFTYNGGDMTGAGTVNFISGTHTFSGNYHATSPLTISSANVVFNSAVDLASVTLSGGASDFDPRTYGFRKLSDLVRSTGAFEIDQPEGRAEAAVDG